MDWQPIHTFPFDYDGFILVKVDYEDETDLQLFSKPFGGPYWYCYNGPDVSNDEILRDYDAWVIVK